MIREMTFCTFGHRAIDGYVGEAFGQALPKPSPYGGCKSFEDCVIRQGLIGREVSRENEGALADAFESRSIARLAYQLLKSGGLSIRAIEPTLKDEASGLVVEALLARGGLNISQIDQYVRSVRGKSSRNTVRHQIDFLLQNGIIRHVEGNEWALTEMFLRKCWAFFSRQS